MRTVNDDYFEQFPKIIGGRYGLSSKEFTPSMVNAIVNNLKEEHPKHNFTIGIDDDITHLSLDYSENIEIENNVYEALLYQTKSDKSIASFNNALELIGEHNYVQGYTECDYKKTHSRQVSNLRIAANPIKAPYLITDANFIACDDVSFIEDDNVLERLKINGVLLVNTQLKSDTFWKSLSVNKQYQILEKNITIYSVDTTVLKGTYSVNQKSISALQACFFALKSALIYTDDISDLKQFIFKVDTLREYNSEVKTIDDGDEFAQTLLGKLLAGKGNELPVSKCPIDGT